MKRTIDHLPLESSSSSCSSTDDDNAVARKRRKEKLVAHRMMGSSVRPNNEESHLASNPTTTDTEDHPTDSVSGEESIEDEDMRRQALIRGIKKQARYVPGVPMSRDELKAWRKEARRVRNRESAAASRQKTRSRIEQLEEEVEEWKVKYSAALQRIIELEQSNTELSMQDAQSKGKHVSVSPSSSAANSVTASPPPSPFMQSRDYFTTLGSSCRLLEQRNFMDMISRPTVV